ncbi:MAG TPA: glycine cleavage system protein H [Clostridia bacterium]|nr:glycine cleavage system protein H [Clostridia bacterium]
MTVILVLATFVTFIAIDYFLARKKAPVFAAQQVRRDVAVPRVQTKVIGGFQVQPNLKYHPGHTWAVAESPNLVRVGIDDFAAKLVGKVEAINLPQRGQWIRQGQKVLSFKKNGQTIDMVSPIEGSITDINDAAIKNPELARTDCYGDGWLLAVQSPDAKTNFRNLLGGALVRQWTEECAARLSGQMARPAMVAMADGGEAADDLSTHFEAEKYGEIVKEFFLS